MNNSSLYLFLGRTLGHIHKSGHNSSGPNGFHSRGIKGEKPNTKNGFIDQLWGINGASRKRRGGLNEAVRG